MKTSRLAKDMHRQLIRYSATITDEAAQKPFLDNLNRMSRLNVRENMIKDARDLNCFKTEDLDKNVWLFNCINGTYDLKNGYFRKHSPNDLISRMSNVFYDENAECPVFEKFYDEILMGNSDKKHFLQTVFGYSLTGDTSEECFFILYGATTRNGKGTLMETIAHMMGGDAGYAATAQPETFARKQNRDSRQASGDIARLKGVRFLNVSEPPKGMILDAALMKTLTGRDTITARHLHEREFQFIPAFKLCMNTNYLPQVNDDTIFGSDRIRVVTFERHFSDNERDRTLKDRLRSPENISGLFNWCLKGLERWKKEGLYIPNAIKAATEQYRNSSDKQATFFDECMIADNSACVKAKDVFDVYRSWCRDNAFYTENKSNFFAGLRSKNLLTDQAYLNGMMTHNVIQGYRIADEYLPQPDINYDNQTPPF
jgi:putative DNA primase/helicase